MINSSKAYTWMKVAKIIGSMSTCPRRNVGAVILNDLGHVLSTGFNGVPSGMTSCYDNDCGASSEPTKDGLDKCIAVHAEMNALMQLRSPREATDIIITSSPCKHCMKMLLNTEIRFIAYGELYDKDAMAMWMDNERDYANVYV